MIVLFFWRKLTLPTELKFEQWTGRRELFDDIWANAANENDVKMLDFQALKCFFTEFQKIYGLHHVMRHGKAAMAHHKNNIIQMF